jgi:hypothetical protein
MTVIVDPGDRDTWLTATDGAIPQAPLQPYSAAPSHLARTERRWPMENLNQSLSLAVNASYRANGAMMDATALAARRLAHPHEAPLQHDAPHTQTLGYHW